VNALTLEHARAAKRKLAERLAHVDGVVGVGIAKVDGQYAVKVNLCQPLNDPTVIPEDVDGVPVHLDMVGTIRPRPAP
jgi:hypothetical protein